MPLLLATALAALFVQAARPAAPDTDIVVVGQRMRHLKIVTRIDRKSGGPYCLVKRSSGDAVFDSRICEAIRTCESTDKNAHAIEGCITLSVQAYIKELAAKRQAALPDAVP